MITYKKTRFLFVLMAICHMCVAQTQQQKAADFLSKLKSNNNHKFAYTKGQFQVTDEGALNYEIPIITVPGTAGMTPKVTLQYNSNNSNGLLGEGWNLTGLSVISRTNQTWATDNVNGKIAFDDNDRLALDGQRLINYNRNDPYWPNVDNVEYRTELNTFQQIRGFYAGNELKRFEVRTKDGLTYYYGAISNDSEEDAYLREDNGHHIMSWLLVQIADLNGNQIRFQYNKQALDKHLIEPTFIKYTGYKNDPNSFYTDIQFNYDEKKTGGPVRYLNGQKIQNDEFLTSITCYYTGANADPANSIIRQYKIHYAASALDDTRLHIDHIDEIAGNDVLRTDFSWLKEHANFKTDEAHTVINDAGQTLTEDYQVFTGDFNGDGWIDKCAVRIEDDSIRFVYAANTGGKFGNAYSYAVPAKVDKKARIILSDFDSNGTSDFSFNWASGDSWHSLIILSPINLAKQEIAKPVAGPVITKPIDHNINPNEIFYTNADFNGDGLQDLACYYYLADKIKITYAINSKDHHFVTTNLQTIPTVYRSPSSTDTVPKNTPVNMGDFNGDGISDFLFTWTDGSHWHSVTALLNRDLSSTSTPESNKSDVFSRREKVDYTLVKVDKGKIDSLVIDSVVSVKNASNEIFPNINFPASKSVYVVDLNHDGNPDLLISYMDKTGWRTWVAIGKGNGEFEAPVQSIIDTQNYPYQYVTSFGDFNGDGQIDLCYSRSDEKGWFVKIAYGKSDGTFSLNGGNEIALDNSNFSYHAKQPTKGIFPATKFITGFGDVCASNLKAMNADQDVPTDIVGNPGKIMQYFINKSHQFQLIPTPYFGISTANFYDGYTFDDKQKAITANDGNFKRVESVSIYPTDGNAAPINRYKVTSDANCKLNVVYSGVTPQKEDVSYPNSMDFVFVDYWKPIFADLDGDGVTDIALTYARQPENNLQEGDTNPLKGSWKTVVVLNTCKISNKIDSIYFGNGAGIKVKYTNLVKQGAFNSDLNLQYPYLPYNLPLNVVGSTISPDGAGGKSTVGYEYKNGIYHLTGRGFLGFQTVTTKNSVTGESRIKTSTTDTVFMKWGLLPLTHSKVTVNGKTVSDETYTNQLLPDRNNPGIASYYIGTKESRSYDLDGKLLTKLKNTYIYDDYGNLTNNTAYYPDGHTESLSNDYWETSGTPTGKNFLNRWIIGRLSKATLTKSRNPDPQINRSSDFTYDPLTGQLTLEETLTGTQYQIDKEHFYDERGNEIRQKAYPENNKADSAVTTFTYGDTYKRFLTAKKDAMGYQIRYTPDLIYGVNREIFDANNNKQSFGFDNGEFDPFGRIKKVYAPDGSSSYEEIYKCSNCQVPNAVYFKLVGNSATEFPKIVFYDVLDRPFTTISFDVNYNIIEKDDQYYPSGRLKQSSSPYVISGPQPPVISYSKFDYDDLGRIEVTVNPDGTKNTFTYNGTTTVKTNTIGQKNTSISDLMGRKLYEVDNLNDTTRYAYDLDNNLTQIKNLGKQLFTYTYNADLDKIADSNNPNLKNRVTYSYDAWGEVQTVKSGLYGKNITEFKYDKIGRMISRVEKESHYAEGIHAPDNAIQDEIDVQYILPGDTAAGKGQIKSIIVKGDNRKLDKYFEYDQFGRLKNKSFIFNNFEDSEYDRPVKKLWDDVVQNKITISYTYNAAGQLNSIIYPKLRSVNYRTPFEVIYNYQNGIVKNVTHNNIKLWELKDLYADGVAQSILFNQGKQETDYTYNPNNRNMYRINTKINGNSVQDWNYRYDDIGNVQSKVDNVNSQQFKETYTFDGENRITSTTFNSTVTTYRYDNAGNLIYKSNAGYYRYLDDKLVVDKDSLNAFGNNEDQHGGHDDLEWYYDKAGNRYKKEERESTELELGYTAFNKPDFIYDHLNTMRTDYFYDENNDEQIELINYKPGRDPENFKSPSGDYACKFKIDGLFEFTLKPGYTLDQRFFIAVNGAVFAVNDIGNDVRNDNIIYLLKDNLNTVTATTNGNKLLNTFAYDVWGARRNTRTWKLVGDGGYTRGFGGNEEWDNMGLVNMGGRVYDPIMAEFLQADPVLNMENPSNGMSAYSYAFDNPLYYNDPTGYWFGSGLVKGVTNFFKDPGRGIVRGLILSPIGGFSPLTIAVANSPGVSGFIDKNAGTIVTVEGIVGSVILNAMGVPPAATAFASGFATTFSEDYLNGASIGQSFSAGLKRGAISAGVAVVTGYIGDYFSGTASSAPVFESSVENYAGRAVTQSAFEGLVNVAQGGNFWQGALPALVSVGSEYLVSGIDGTDVGARMERTAIAATLGGTASELGGGKFANGAFTAAMVHLYNYEGHYSTSGTFLGMKYSCAATAGNLFYVSEDNPGDGSYTAGFSGGASYYQTIGPWGGPGGGFTVDDQGLTISTGWGYGLLGASVGGVGINTGGHTGVYGQIGPVFGIGGTCNLDFPRPTPALDSGNSFLLK